MALSMTGFGRGSYANRFFAVKTELRSVNHRFLEISMRLPRILAQFEDRIRQVVGGQLNRGKVEITMRFDILDGGETRVRLDKGLAAGYRAALLELASRHDLPPDLKLDHFVRLPDLFTIEPAELDKDVIWEGIHPTLVDALAELAIMRRAEGDELLADLTRRIEAVSGQLGIIEERAPLVPESYRAQLRQRLAEVLGQPGIDETRLAQEVVLFADRCCIMEEIVRFRSHLGQLRETLRMQGALGRKADFILQEANREINTMGAKANDLTIAQAVIEVKAELERIREQIQNLE